jgi:hypothetical protein
MNVFNNLIALIEGEQVKYDAWLKEADVIKYRIGWFKTEKEQHEYLGIGVVYSINGKLKQNNNVFFHFWRKIENGKK